MIKLQEICSVRYEGLDWDVRFNLSRLHFSLNSLRALYNRPMIVSSGLRTKEQHEIIYFKKNADRVAKGLPEILIPQKSWHLMGAAADILDPQNHLKEFILDRVDVLEMFGLWCEDFDVTDGYIHFQIYPPVSGKRFFKP